MSERPLHDFIDMEAYDVVSGETYRKLAAAAKEIEQLAFRHYADWMHFHEVAMADPFKAESEAQSFAERVMVLASDGLGSESVIHREAT